MRTVFAASPRPVAASRRAPGTEGASERVAEEPLASADEKKERNIPYDDDDDNVDDDDFYDDDDDDDEDDDDDDDDGTIPEQTGRSRGYQMIWRQKYPGINLD